MAVQCGYSILGGNNAEKEITTIMEAYGVRVCDEDFDYVIYFTVRVEAQFECSKCNFRWSTHNSTIKIDLNRCCISKKYRQKCKRCRSYWALPCIRSDKLKSVVVGIMKHSWKMENAGHFLPFDDGPSTPDHSEGYCERCKELSKPCHLWETKTSKILSGLDCSPATSIFRQVPCIMASYIQKHQHLLYQELEEMSVEIKVHNDDQCGFIHLLPTKTSKNIIEDWNKICENKLDTILKRFDTHSLLLQPELLPELQGILKEIKLDMSLHVEKQTIFQVAGKTQEVKNTIENIQQMQKKPCIVPF